MNALPPVFVSLNKAYHSVSRTFSCGLFEHSASGLRYVGALRTFVRDERCAFSSPSYSVLFILFCFLAFIFFAFQLKCEGGFYSFRGVLDKAWSRIYIYSVSSRPAAPLRVISYIMHTEG